MGTPTSLAGSTRWRPSWPFRKRQLRLQGDAHGVADEIVRLRQRIRRLQEELRKDAREPSVRGA
ncbi:MAG: hypothetical protein Q9O62_01225 [Ardenticatenia bacterium]|nr:hypothetical protein [Ardenticatenia bacterium]